MSSETFKTTVMLVVALVLSVTAYLYMPQPIRLESQARVEENLFQDYDVGDVAIIEVESLPDPAMNLTLVASGSQTISVQKSSRGWVLPEFDNYPAGNTQLIGRVAASLNNLEILEVVSDNPGPEELQEYGVVNPAEYSGEEPGQVGVRVKLVDATRTPLGELIVGKMVRTANEVSYYVRSLSENGVFRVQISKDDLSPFLLNWVDPNILSIQTPEGLMAMNRGFRTIEQVMVSTGKGNRQGSDSYRAYFGMNPIAMQRQEVWRDDQWQSAETVAVSAPWQNGLQVVPAVIYMADVQRKSTQLEQAMEVGVLTGETSLGELTNLGFELVSEGEDSFLMGAMGRAAVDVLGGMRFHFAFGAVTEKGHIPVVIYAEPSPEGLPDPPVKETLPPEAEDWDQEKRESELDLIERRFQEAKTNYQQLRGQLTQELRNINQSVAPWIYYIPKEVMDQFIPDQKIP